MKTLTISAAPKAVKTAFDHVTDYYPDVKRVVFEDDSFWTYYNEDGTAPIFDEDVISVDALNDALDSVYHLAPITFVK